MLTVNVSLIIGEFSAAGWLAYPPLSELAYSPGVGVDYWIWSLQIAGVGSLLAGINFMLTILKMRAPGMTLMKMPIFVWSVLGSMSLVVFAFPILTATLTMLSLDRLLGMHFFTGSFGGNPMMYINLIWAWGPSRSLYLNTAGIWYFFGDCFDFFQQTAVWLCLDGLCYRRYYLLVIFGLAASLLHDGCRS